jgi:DNA-binding XRE family transcriptional regulator
MEKKTRPRQPAIYDETPVPNRLKEILSSRKTSHLYPNSYATLASVANVSKNTVVYLARGDYVPKLDSAYKIARALNVTVYDIWNEIELERFLNELTEEQAVAVIAAMEAEDEG